MTEFVMTTKFDYAIMGGPRLFLQMEIARDGQSIIFYSSERRQVDRIYCSWEYDFETVNETSPNIGNWFENWTVEWSDARECDRNALGIDKHLIVEFIMFLDKSRSPFRKIKGETHRVGVRVNFQ